MLQCYAGSWDGDFLFSDLLEFVFTKPVELLKSICIDFGDISFNLWDLSIGLAIILLVAFIVRRIME